MSDKMFGQDNRNEDRTMKFLRKFPGLAPHVQETQEDEGQERDRRYPRRVPRLAEIRKQQFNSTKEVDRTVKKLSGMERRKGF